MVRIYELALFSELIVDTVPYRTEESETMKYFITKPKNQVELTVPGFKLLFEYEHVGTDATYR